MASDARLLIMRHGEAGPGQVDHARTLTAQGEYEAARMAGWLAAQNDLGAVRLCASPYRRAQQTAAAVSDALGVPVETLSNITPDDAPRAVSDWLLAQPEGETIMLVSHMPLVGALCGYLVEGRETRGPAFATGALAELTAPVWAAGVARLVRFIEPGQL
ncbi:phosphohistidine phosphatase SixA [Halomonas sp. PAMB 3264]|uniref:phosphohistidine phosphatase SixA n=1 Tax=Halomonas sp. PAMB 3264 TaxID=3075222 RepID=UPI0028A21719|nr:phosphohistidine phosphatase SixA [Halomonas sp. PAMB 3264]WNL43642.1 phosphohistidine phosphatase SixA [Halomonas sp. PAMB 3264]